LASCGPSLEGLTDDPVRCAALDLGLVETDKQVNVPFYERFGFEVVAQAPVLGVPNWFMARTAAASIHPPRA
jgi:hypothetical protein